MDNKYRDLHVQRRISAIDGYPGAWIVAEYEVRRFDDVRDLQYEKSYLIKSKLRLCFPGISPADASADGYNGYPIRIDVAVRPSAATEYSRLELVDYFPRTVNSSVSTVQNSGVGTSLTSSRQHSSGSSLSQTNSYSIGATIGAFGDALTGGVSYERGHSETSTQERSDTVGLDRGRNLESGSSSSMSVLDWSSYSQPDYEAASIGWTWSQEFPLNAIDYENVATTDSFTLVGPDLGNVLNGGMLMPPSRLALFGVDFVCSANWIYRPGKDGAGGAPWFSTQIAMTSGSHTLQGTGSDAVVSFVMTQGTPTTIEPLSALDCVALALDPITCEGPDSGAVVGFVNTDFAPDGKDGKAVVCTSAANTLSVTAAGFEIPGSPDCILTASVTPASHASLTIRFKILDALNDYTLFIKSWIETDVAAMLSIKINGREAGIVRHVDSAQNSSGSDNITSVILRNTEFAASEYVDYLQMGLNTIDIDISPPAGASAETTCRYALRSLGIA